MVLDGSCIELWLYERLEVMVSLARPPTAYYGTSRT